MARKFIPQERSEFTPEWLTSCLREEGYLTDQRVEAVDTSLLGDGAGFMGDVVKLAIKYDKPAPDAPASMIAKLPGSIEKNRKLGRWAGVYEREINFYRTLASRIEVRTPAHIYSAMDDSGSSKTAIPVMRVINRMPRPILLALITISLWLSGLRKHRFLLLIEDMGDLRVGDQVAGCSPEDAEVAVVAMARMHAQFWNNAAIDDYPWVMPVNVSGNMFQRLFQKSLPKIRESFGDTLTASDHEALAFLDAHGAELAVRLAGPPWTLLHGDFRLDNMLFDDENREVVLLDWQGPLKAAPGFEVAYFLTASLSIDTEAAVEEGLLHTYHDELARAGISYSFERLKWEYQSSTLLMLQRIFMAFDEDSPIDLGQARGRDLLVTWRERLSARLSGIDYSTLLEAMPN